MYDRIRGLDHILWGFFTPNPFTPEGKAKRQEVEEKLDFEFPVNMWYRYLATSSRWRGCWTPTPKAASSK